MRKNLLILFALITCGTLSAQTVIFNVLTPPSVAGGYDFTLASVDNGWTLMPDMTNPDNAVTDTLVIVSDGSASDSLGCNPLVNLNQVAGKIAVIYRGTCSFGEKAKKAMDAGAVGVIIVNHSPGLVNMLGGDSGATVDIPAIFVENVTGAQIHDAVRKGDVTAYIGVKPTYAIDMASSRGLCMWPSTSALPASLYDTFDYSPAIWVKNNGTADQTGVVVTCKINNGAADVYNQQQTVNCPSGDSVLVSLSAFTPTYGERGYKITYTIAPATADEFNQDNTISNDFAFTTDMIAYSPIDYNAGKIKPNAFYRYNTASPAKYCIAFKNEKASRLKAKGMSFAMTANAGFSLKDQYLHFSFYEWNDNFVDLNGNVTYDDLSSVADADYVFPDDIRETPIYVPFTQEVTLVDNKRYLGCIEFSIPEVYIGSNTNTDLFLSINEYLQATTPGQDGNEEWAANGAAFGFDNVLAIGLHTSAVNVGIKSNNVSDLAPAYPMPSKNVVNIPMAANGAKSADVKIIDVTGKVVATVTGKFETGRSLQINTSEISNGSYVFNVNFDNGKTANYRVVISH